MLTRARVLAVAALLAGALGSYIWLSAAGDGGHHKVAAPARIATGTEAGLRTALGYVSQSAPFVAVLQTGRRRTAVRALLGLADRFPGSAQAFTQAEGFLRDRTGFDLTGELGRLAGNPIVVAGSASAVVVSWVTASETALQDALTAGVDSGNLQAAGTYHSADLFSALQGGVVASSGPVVIAGTSLQAVRSSIDRQSNRFGTLTPARFDARAAGVPRSALLRVVAGGPALRHLIGRLYRGAPAVPWVSAISRGALAVSAAGDGLHSVMKLSTTSGVLTADDLPLAPGKTAPVLNGSAPLMAGVRDAAHLVDFLLAAGQSANAPVVAAYQQINKLLSRFAHIDLDQDIVSTLTGPATISTTDLHRFDLRATTTDASGVQDVLRRIAGIGRIGGFLGVDFGGFAVKSGNDGLVTITHDDSPVITLGIRDGVLVASTDPGADFDAIANGPERDGGQPPDRGALRVRLSPKLLSGLIVDRLGLPDLARIFFEPLGTTLLTAQASGGDITARAFLPVK